MNGDQVNPFADIKYVFLDRDGVLNCKPPRGGFVTRPDELALLPDVAAAVARLNRSGRKLIVVTNQRGIALGLYSQDDLAHIHEKLKADLAAAGGHLDAIYVCPHEAGQCDCRKPLTGLFEQAFRDFPAAHPANSVMAGDSLRDIEAGVSLGMRTAFLADSAEMATPEGIRAKAQATVNAASLPDFVSRYLDFDSGS